MKNYDYLIVGAGIVGLTVARELKSRFPTATIAIVDKEERIGVHASGRNSGVLHCGIYYGQDTLKAKVCAQGAKRMMAFATEHAIPFSKLGKVILATSTDQLPTVERLMRNAKDNGINAERIGHAELRELEPAAADGPAAIYCPDTAVIDSLTVIKKLQNLLEQQSVVFYFGCEVKDIPLAQQLLTSKGKIGFGYLFNCAGAHADSIARYVGLAQAYTLVPFKGIYWKLSSQANPFIRANIYPVPDVSLPFLGVHLTRVMSGEVYVGPTAIPVFGRENYQRFQGMNIKEALKISSQLASMFVNNENNFRLLAKTEIAKYRKSAFLKAAQKLCPQIKAKDLVPTAKAGIRPQLINLKTKKLEMDYIFQHTEYSTHVLNAISPAFTSSFAFAEMIVNESQV